MITEANIERLKSNIDKVFKLKKETPEECTKEILMILMDSYDYIELADALGPYFLEKKEIYGKLSVSRAIGLIRGSMISNIKMIIDKEEELNNLKNFLTEIETTRGFGMSRTERLKSVFKIIKSKIFR